MSARTTYTIFLGGRDAGEGHGDTILENKNQTCSQDPVVRISEVKIEQRDFPPQRQVLGNNAIHGFPGILWSPCHQGLSAN